MKYLYIIFILSLGGCINTEVEPHEKYSHDLIYKEWLLSDVTQQGRSKMEEYESFIGVIWEFKNNGVIDITSPTGTYKGTWSYSNKGDEYTDESEYYSGEPILINCYYYDSATFYVTNLNNMELVLSGGEGVYYFK